MAEFKNEFTFKSFLEDAKEDEFDRFFDLSVAKVKSDILGKKFPMYIDGKEVYAGSELAKKNLQVSFPMMLKEVDIETEVERIYEILTSHADAGRMVTFSTVARSTQFNDVLLELFIPLLFLAHKNRVTLIQERFFDEIIIALN